MEANISHIGDNEPEWVEVYGARENNLQDIDVRIPRNKLTVVTGVSGSGKSSLAFDTIYAEGQRRYMETLSAYARRFIGGMERPDVDKVEGLSPVIAISQKTVSKNPRSTVGTITEIYDFLRLLYARVADAYSMNTGEKMVRYTEEQIFDMIVQEYDGKAIYVLAPVVRGRKGHYRDLFEQMMRKGFLHARINGVITELQAGLMLDRYKAHFIEAVIDKMEVQAKYHKRLKESLGVALKYGKGTIMVVEKGENDGRFFSKFLSCPTTGLAYNEPAPHSFSFNSPQGACPKCSGLGEVTVIDMKKIIPDPKKSIMVGGIAPLGAAKKTAIFAQIEAILAKFKCTLSTPIEQLPEEALQQVLYGIPEPMFLQGEFSGIRHWFTFEGIVTYIMNSADEESSKRVQAWSNQFIKTIACPECEGTRLKKEALYFRIGDKNIAELSMMDIQSLSDWLDGIEGYLSPRQLLVGNEIIKELRTRIGFLLNVGLYYLSLNLSAKHLSGGESQRIRLATQIGSQLVNVLYILDEPSIGLHQRDNHQLISALRNLTDMGNTVVVVEHDRDMMLAADYLVDIGPGAGKHGGQVVAAGEPAELLKGGSTTARYLRGDLKIELPAQRRPISDKVLRIEGASGNNLKDINVDFPLGCFICVTGVSGSGKSTLINETLQPILSKHIYKSVQEPLAYKSISGLEFIDKVIQVDQNPIGRTPRSNPATYTGVFSHIRELFAKVPEAQVRGYKQGRFSFNIKGGRCETCKGAGLETIEMNFLPDVYVTCKECGGKRYNRETLEVKYRNKSISDVLDMTINEAVEFFANHPQILNKLKTIQDIGLGYITLGQSSTTLSGGECQRIKLSTELSKRSTGQTVYILDEPTTGLHFEDIQTLLNVLQLLVDKGNTVIVIEHNMDVIKMADYIIDMGPEGGKFGGQVLTSGTPEEVVKCTKSHTAKFLKEELG